MNNILQSVAWWGFVPEKLSPEQFVRAVAETGYAGIDLVPRQYWPLVRAHGLAIASSEAHASITLGLNRYDQHERIENEIRVQLALAREWHIPNLICFSGNRAACSDEDGIEITTAGLVRVAAAAEAAGVTLVLELLNSIVDHPGYQADHTRWGVEVCRRVDSARVRLLFDIYHMQTMEGDIIRTIQAINPLIGHYHDAGYPGRNEPDETQEINYPAVWRAIALSGYGGYIAHEFIPRGDPVEALQAAYRQCAACL